MKCVGGGGPGILKFWIEHRVEPRPCPRANIVRDVEKSDRKAEVGAGFIFGTRESNKWIS